LDFAKDPGRTSTSGGLVEGVKEGDINDLLDKVFGLAARDPQQYCRAVKQKIKTQRLAMETFDLMAHRPMGTWPI
jgi:hypothetical protein